MSISPEDTFLGDDEAAFEADLSEETGKVIPEGEYEVVCFDVERKVSSTGNPMFVWKFKAPGKGRNFEFTYYTALSKAAMFKVAETLSALGVGKPGEKVSFTKRQVIGRRAIAVVKTEEFNGSEGSKIGRLKPHPQGPVREPGGDDLP